MRPALMCVVCLLLAMPSSAVDPDQIQIQLKASRLSVGLGQSVEIQARLESDALSDLKGIHLEPYVDGKRWGSEEITDAEGKATFSIPFPYVGRSEVQVAANLPSDEPVASWIWSEQASDGQSLWLSRIFKADAKVLGATLSIACDDVCSVWLNGEKIKDEVSFQKAAIIHLKGKQFKKGDNTLGIAARNANGPAGFIASLEMETADEIHTLISDTEWTVYPSQPEGWETGNLKPGAPAKAVAPLGGGAWAGLPSNWRGMPDITVFPVGKPLMEDAIVSDPIQMEVLPREIRMPLDEEHLVAIEWEPWFTPLNMRWQTAQAQPVVGYYDSYNRDVIRQHALWMAEAGINLLIVDWTNNLWDKKHWSERGEYVNELVKAVSITLEVYSGMQSEGIPVPKLALLTGLDNGPQTTMTALNEQHRFAYEHLVSPGKFRSLWLDYEGKPLIIPFNGSGMASERTEDAVDESLYTVRWMSSQHQVTKFGQKGYWSWMDGVMEPLPAMRDGKPEALTVTPAFFGDGGWLSPNARGRRNGATFIGTFQTALKHRPKFLIINQWNEFAGQPEGSGYGEKKDVYLDCYNVPFSNDIEPTSLNSPAYRSQGGYGYYYHNLMRALISLYHETVPASSLLAIAQPEDGATVEGDQLAVEWIAIGKAPTGFSVLLDGQPVAGNIAESTTMVPLKGLAPGQHTLRVEAMGTQSRFPLSKTTEDTPLDAPVKASAEISFTTR